MINFMYVTMMSEEWRSHSGPSKIETVMANLTQIVPNQNTNAHMQTKN